MLKLLQVGVLKVEQKEEVNEQSSVRCVFRGRKVVQIGVPKETQSMLRSERTIRRKKEKYLREFKFLKMDLLGCLIGFLQIFVKILKSLMKVNKFQRVKRV